MDSLFSIISQDSEDIIYKYKHNLDWKDVMDEIKKPNSFDDILLTVPVGCVADAYPDHLENLNSFQVEILYLGMIGYIASINLECNPPDIRNKTLDLYEVKDWLRTYFRSSRTFKDWCPCFYYDYQRTAVRDISESGNLNKWADTPNKIKRSNNPIRYLKEYKNNREFKKFMENNYP